MRAAPVVLLAAVLAAPVAVSYTDGPEHVLAAFSAGVPDDLTTFVAPWGTVVVENEELAFAVVLTTKSQAASLIAALEARSDVEDAEVEAALRLLDVPNDPRYAEQWAPPVVRLPEAWDVTVGSHAVKVAYLDTGVDTDHPDLQANRVAGCGPDGNTAEGDISGSAEDTHGHGTHVAGILAATRNNDEGVAGAAQTCLMAVKVCNPGCKTSGVAMGVLYARTHGAKVLSASLGWSTTNTGGANPLVLERAAHAAWTSGLLFVVSAGNDYCRDPSVSTVNMPGRFPESLAVAALAPPGDVAAEFSSCGPEVDITAPGEGILSTGRGGGYEIRSGTSMSAPLVAGVAGLVFSVDPTLTNADVRCILEATAVDLGAPGHDIRHGHGRVDARAAVDAATDPASVGC